MSAEPLSALQGAGENPAPASDTAQLRGMDEMPAIPDTLAILPVRGFVVFPRTVAPLNVERASSIQLLNETLPQNKIIGLVAQRDEAKEEPGESDLYQVGTAVTVLKLLRQADNHVVVIAQGLRRFAIRKVIQTSPFLRAEVEALKTLPAPTTKEFEAAFRNLRDSAAKLLELTPDVPEQARAIVLGIEDAEELTDFLAPNLNLDVAQKEALLEESDLEKRLRAVQASISSQLEIAQIQQKLQQDVQSQFSDAQRRAYLREQVKAIQRELGEGDSGADEQRAAVASEARGSETAGRGNETGGARIEEARFHPASEPGLFCDRDLHRNDCRVALVEDEPGQSRPRQGAGDSRPRSLRSGKSEATPDRISRRAQTQSRGARADPVFPRAARRGQDEPRPIHRRRTRKKVRQDESGWDSRRSGNPRPSPHLHRLDAGAHHPGTAPRRHAQSGHDAG